MINTIELTDKSKVILKFVMKKIKGLVADPYGQLLYIRNLDNVIYDIYGFKNFISKINGARSNREHLALFMDFGLNELIEMTETPHIYSAIDELVSIDYRINELEKSFKKLQKKGKKKSKNDLKEYEYIKDLYKNAVKRIKKELDLTSNKKQYKKRYSAVNDLLDKKSYMGMGTYWDDDDYSISRMVDRVYDLDDDDDDDEYTLSDYLSKMSGKRSKKKKRKKLSRVYDLDDDDEELGFGFDDDDDDDELDDYDVSDLFERIDNLTDGYTKLVRVVEHLSDAQSNINQSESFVIENYMKNQQHTPSSPQVNQSGQSDPKTAREINNMKRSINALESSIINIADTNDKIFKFLNSVLIDDDEDDEDELRVNIAHHNEVIDMINREDFSDNETDLTREQMIDIVNKNETIIKKVATPNNQNNDNGRPPTVVLDEEVHITSSVKEAIEVVKDPIPESKEDELEE